MKFHFSFIFFLISIMSFAQDNISTTTSTVRLSTESQEDINWMSWDEAHEANKKSPKKIFIDIYTEWCGWCKKMDKSTFKDPAVVKELNANFYAVKLDAEQKETINFNGNDFVFVSGGRKGVHQLAYALLDGRLGYPAFVMLDEGFARIMLSPGYKKPAELIKELEFSSSDAYKKHNFADWK